MLLKMLNFEKLKFVSFILNLFLLLILYYLLFILSFIIIYVQKKKYFNK